MILEKIINELIESSIFDEKIRIDLLNIKQKLNENKIIYFMGIFSSCKTSVINYLLNINLIATADEEVNAVLLFYKYSINEYARVNYMNDNVRDINIEEISKYIEQDKIRVNADKIKKVEVFLNNDLLKQFTITNTPKINTPYYKHIDQTYKYEIIGDLIVYTVLADTGIKDSDLIELKKLKNKNKKVILLLTRIDDIIGKNNSNFKNLELKIEETKLKLNSINADYIVIPVSIIENINGNRIYELIEIFLQHLNENDSINFTIINELKTIINEQLEDLINQQQQFKNEKNVVIERLNNMKNKDNEFLNIIDNTKIKWDNMIENAKNNITTYFESQTVLNEKFNIKDFSKYFEKIINDNLENLLIEMRTEIDYLVTERIQDIIKSNDNFIKTSDIEMPEFTKNINEFNDYFNMIFKTLKQNKHFLGDLIEILGYKNYLKKLEGNIKSNIIKDLPNEISILQKNKVAEKLSKKLVVDLKKVKIGIKIIEGFVSLGEVALQIFNEYKNVKKINAYKQELILLTDNIKDNLKTEIVNEAYSYYKLLLNKTNDEFNNEIKMLEDNEISRKIDFLEKKINEMKEI